MSGCKADLKRTRLRRQRRAAVPAADLAARILARGHERLIHRVVVIRRDEDGQGHPGEDHVRLARSGEVRERESSELVAEQLLGVHGVVLMDCDELRDPRQVVPVFEWIPVSLRPARGYVGAERQRVRDGPSAEERRAESIVRSGQQKFPIGLSHPSLRLSPALR